MDSVKSHGGVELAIGSRVRRLERSKRERNVRNSYFDLGTVATLVYRIVTAGNQGASSCFVRWDDGRNSTVRAERLVAVVPGGEDA